MFYYFPPLRTQADSADSSSWLSWAFLRIRWHWLTLPSPCLAKNTRTRRRISAKCYHCSPDTHKHMQSEPICVCAFFSVNNWGALPSAAEQLLTKASRVIRLTTVTKMMWFEKWRLRRTDAEAYCQPTLPARVLQSRQTPATQVLPKWKPGRELDKC